MNQCPCKSEEEFSKCCEAYLEGKESAPTAMALMRSRYTAFVKGSIDYIVETHNPDTRSEVNKSELKSWALNSTWMGLEVLSEVDGKKGDKTGQIEFIATYRLEGTIHRHHELSDFDLIDNKWYFTDGKQIPVKSEKIGRNEACPCDSGKKYKKCCGQ